MISDQTPTANYSDGGESDINLSSTPNYTSMQDVPEDMLNDAMGSCANIMTAFESSTAESGNVEALNDAMLLKAAALQQSQSDQLKSLANKTKNAQPKGDNGYVPGFDPVTRSEMLSIIKDCPPCTGRPEVLGGFKFAVDLSLMLFSNLLDRFNILRYLVKLRLPSSSYDEMCSIVNALNSFCVPDINRIILLMKYRIASLLRKVTLRFNFSIEKLADMLLVPFILALEGLLIGIADGILKPIECTMYSVEQQARKIPGLSEELEKFNDTNTASAGKDQTGIFYLLGQIRQARDMLRTDFSSLQHDFYAAICQSGLEVDGILELIEQIKEATAFYNMLKALIELHGQSQTICDPSLNTDPVGYYYGLARSSVGDQHVTTDDNGHIYIFDDPPITFSEEELTKLDEIHERANQITPQEIIKASESLLGDQTIQWGGKERVNITNDQNETDFQKRSSVIADITDTYRTTGQTSESIVNKNSNKSLNTSNDKANNLPEDLGGKMVAAIIDLKHCIERGYNDQK